MNGYVWDGGGPEGLDVWVRHAVGVGHCYYSWRRRHGWFVTVVTVNGDEVLHPGDTVVKVAHDKLGIVRRSA